MLQGSVCKGIWEWGQQWRAIHYETLMDYIHLNPWATACLRGSGHRGWLHLWEGSELTLESDQHVVRMNRSAATARHSRFEPGHHFQK
jgi:hypothetical protein